MCILVFCFYSRLLIIFYSLCQIYLHIFCGKFDAIMIFSVCTDVLVNVANLLTWSTKQLFLVFHAVDFLLELTDIFGSVFIFGACG